MSAVPIELRTGPFSVARARELGMHWDNLQARAWRRMARGQYTWTGLADDIELKLLAAVNRLPPTYAFSGRTAAWIFGLDMPPCEPIEATIPRELSARTRASVRVRRAALPDTDVVLCGGFRVTSGLRTARDLGSTRDLIESVVSVDMALHAGLTDLETLAEWVQRNTGAKGVKRLRRVVNLANARAESPMETRLRLELISGGLPAPCVQTVLRDGDGSFLARVDLFYSDVRLVIEYDGQNHKDRLVDDMRRQNALINAGYHVLRFTAPDLNLRGAVASQVRRARNRLLRHTA